MANELAMADVEAFCDLVVTAKLEKVREQLAKQKALANCMLSGTPVLILAIDEELPIMTRTLLEAGADCAPDNARASNPMVPRDSSHNASHCLACRMRI